MSWTLFGQLCIVIILVWLLTVTAHSAINDQRYKDALRRKQSGVNL